MHSSSISATLNAKESLDAAASNPQDSAVIGISSDALQLLDYRSITCCRNTFRNGLCDLLFKVF